MNEWIEYFSNKKSWVEGFFLPKNLEIDFEKLWNKHPKEFHKIKVFGKEHFTPRWQQVYGINYKFSGTISDALPIPKNLEKFINYFSKRYNCKFNMLLINWYKDGEHNIGMHSDDEKNIVPNSPVITISFGTTRRFIIQSKETKKKEEFKLQNNEVLVMAGTFQKTHKHGIPKEKKVKKPRISITLRVMKK